MGLHYLQGLEFRCSNNGSSDGQIDLCMNGGTCLVLNDSSSANNCIQECLCQGEFTHDNEFFHFPNCTRQKYSTRWLVLQFVLGSVIILLGFVRLLRMRKMRADAMHIAYCQFAALSIGSLSVGTIYAQNGCFEACAVLSNTAFCINGLCASLLILAITRPIFGTDKHAFKRFSRFIWSVYMFIIALFVCAMATMLAFTRDRNPARYNAAALFSLISVFIGVLIQAVITFVWTQRLKKEMSNSLKRVQSVRHSAQAQAATSKVQDLLRRTKVLQTVIGVLPLLIFPVGVAIPVSLFYLHSVPYFYVVMYLLTQTGLIFAACVLFFLWQSSFTVTSPATTAPGAAAVGRGGGGVEPEAVPAGPDRDRGHHHRTGANHNQYGLVDPMKPDSGASGGAGSSGGGVAGSPMATTGFAAGASNVVMPRTAVVAAKTAVRPIHGPLSPMASSSAQRPPLLNNNQSDSNLSLDIVISYPAQVDSMGSYPAREDTTHTG